MNFILAGVKIKFGFSFFLVAALMMLFSDGSIAVMCFFSSMVHELGHLLPMTLFSQKIKSISFGAFGVRIECFGEALQSYKKQTIIALGGVFVNLTLSGIASIFWCVTASSNSAAFVFVNLFIALLNLIPAKSLDAWNALYCVLMSKFDERKTCRLLSFISAFAVTGFVIFCVCYFFVFELNISLVAVCIYLIFLLLK